ncbi:MAG: glucuronate isomerase [Sporomusaceae bacterium]|nr:glucuronate isomerase [Sporomusaceae bacterium]
MKKVKEFMAEDFLLSNTTARELYEKYAKELPIIDYHCHLSPKEIWEDTKYDNIGQLFLKDDHYKWRIMRAAGIAEDFITGSKSDYEKFLAFAAVLPLAIGNPVYHWTNLELKRYFGIKTHLNKNSAASIWEETEIQIQEKNLSARKFIKMSNVETICTTDDPADSLEYHSKLKKDKKFTTKVLPAFRPDKALNITAPGYEKYLAVLGEASGIEIKDVKTLLEALLNRLDFFASNGCVASDHALSYVPAAAKCSKKDAAKALKKRLDGEKLTPDEAGLFYVYLFKCLAKRYHELGIAMEIHIGALRNTNEKMFQQLGPDKGYDSIYDSHVAKNLAAILGSLETENSLPKTILFSLDTKDYYPLATLCGNYQSTEIPGKMQLGPAWWFCDTIDGMTYQLKSLANLGVLGTFIGMLTDSRSFLSYPRHEYFRRLLCNIIGTWVETGSYPKDEEALAEIIKGICYHNAKRYFGEK